jgi:hypothetical protein
MEDDDGFGDLTDEALLSLEVPAPAPAVASPRPVTAVRAQGLGMRTPPRMQHGGLSRARARARPQPAAAQDERLQELRGQVRNKEHALELVRQPEGKTQRGEQGGGRVHTRRRLTEWLTGPRPVATQACGRGVGAAGSRARRGGAASAGRQAHAGPVQGVWWLCACVCVRACAVKAEQSCTQYQEQLAAQFEPPGPRPATDAPIPSITPTSTAAAVAAAWSGGGGSRAMAADGPGGFPSTRAFGAPLGRAAAASVPPLLAAAASAGAGAGVGAGGGRGGGRRRPGETAGAGMMDDGVTLALRHGLGDAVGAALVGRLVRSLHAATAPQPIPSGGTLPPAPPCPLFTDSVRDGLSVVQAPWRQARPCRGCCGRRRRGELHATGVLDGGGRWRTPCKPCWPCPMQRPQRPM